MTGFVSRLFHRSPESANIAKQRLQLVLAGDRTHIPPETIELLKDEIINVISRHLEIDRANVAISISRGTGGNRLVADIPMTGVRTRRRRTR